MHFRSLRSIKGNELTVIATCCTTQIRLKRSIPQVRGIYLAHYRARSVRKSYIYEDDASFSDESEHDLEEDAASYASDRLECNGDYGASIRRNEDPRKPVSFTVRMPQSHLHTLAYRDAERNAAERDERYKCEICISDLNSSTQYVVDIIKYNIVSNPVIDGRKDRGSNHDHVGR